MTIQEQNNAVLNYLFEKEQTGLIDGVSPDVANHERGLWVWTTVDILHQVLLPAIRMIPGAENSIVIDTVPRLDGSNKSIFRLLIHGG